MNPIYPSPSFDNFQLNFNILFHFQPDFPPPTSPPPIIVKQILDTRELFRCALENRNHNTIITPVLSVAP